MSTNHRPEDTQPIQARVCDYPSPDEVIHARREVFERGGKEQGQDDLESVRRKLAVGLEEIERGDVVDGEQFFQKMLAELESETDLI